MRVLPIFALDALHLSPAFHLSFGGASSGFLCISWQIDLTDCVQPQSTASATMSHCRAASRLAQAATRGLQAPRRGLTSEPAQQPPKLVKYPGVQRRRAAAAPAPASPAATLGGEGSDCPPAHAAVLNPDEPLPEPPGVFAAVGAMGAAGAWWPGGPPPPSPPSPTPAAPPGLAGCVWGVFFSCAQRDVHHLYSTPPPHRTRAQQGGTHVRATHRQ